LLEVDQVVALRAGGATLGAIARRYGVQVTQVRRILARDKPSPDEESNSLGNSASEVAEAAG
jgi:transposase-like protein